MEVQGKLSQGVRNNAETLFFLLFLLFLIFRFFKSVRKETIDCDSNTLSEGVYLKNYRVKKSLAAALREGPAKAGKWRAKGSGSPLLPRNR